MIGESSKKTTEKEEKKYDNIKFDENGMLIGYNGNESFRDYSLQ